MATNVLGHRQVKIVKDIHVNVDQQAVETPGPPLGDLASRASRICSHLRKPNHRDAAISDDASLRCGRVARGEEHDLVCGEQRRSRACLRYRGDRARQAQEVRHTHPIKGPVLGRIGRVQVGV